MKNGDMFIDTTGDLVIITDTNQVAYFNVATQLFYLSDFTEDRFEAYMKRNSTRKVIGNINNVFKEVLKNDTT